MGSYLHPSPSKPSSSADAPGTPSDPLQGGCASADLITSVRAASVPFCHLSWCERSSNSTLSRTHGRV